MELLNDVVLTQGKHDTREQGMNVLEAAALYAGEYHSDEPKTVSRTIAKIMRQWNDDLVFKHRNKILLPLVPKIVGTNTGDLDERARKAMIVAWLQTELPKLIRRLKNKLATGVAISPEKAEIKACRIAEQCGLNALYDPDWDAEWEVAFDLFRREVGTSANHDEKMVAIQASVVKLIERMCNVGKAA
jgi:hypothetical protein